MKTRPFIVKVQASIAPKGLMLVYNSDKSYLYEGPITEDIERRLDGHIKWYFEATYDTETKQISIGRKIKYRRWPSW